MVRPWSRPRYATSLQLAEACGPKRNQLTSLPRAAPTTVEIFVQCGTEAVAIRKRLLAWLRRSETEKAITLQDQDVLNGALATLLDMSLPDLVKEADRRREAIALAPDLAGRVDLSPADLPQEMSVGSEISTAIKNIFRRSNDELRELACGSTRADQKDRRAILNSLHVGDSTLAAAFVSALVSHSGLSPALAAVIAVILVKRLGSPAVEELCAAWSRLSVP